MGITQVYVAVIMLSLHFTLSDGSPTTISRCDRSLEDQNIPDQSDCSKYYRCVYGKKVPKECPEKMLFNPSIGNCDLYYNVDCAHRRKTSEDDNQENLKEAIENLSGRTFVKSAILASTTTVESKYDYSGDSQSSESSTMRFVYLPHENDPSAYYKIENGLKVLLYCEEGMMFSFEMEICARPWG